MAVPPGLRAISSAAPAQAAVPPNLVARGSSAPSSPSAPRPGVESARPPADEAPRRSSASAQSASSEVPENLDASFEAALQQADAQRDATESASGPVEPSVESPPPVGPTIVDVPAVAVALLPEAPPATVSWEDLPLEDPASEGEPSEEEAKAQRQRLLQRAMELGARPASGGEPAPLPADEQQLAQLIEKRYAEVQARREHFSTLGLAIGPDVKREQVKAAFLALAKRFHPDRLPPALSELAPKVGTVFEAIREAYETLYDDARRAAYLQELRSRGASQPVSAAASAQASDLFKMGEVYFRKRDFPTAAEHFERAFGIEPKAVYLAARAWAIYMDPQRKAEAPRVRQMLTEALKLDFRCDRAHYQLGVMARVEGNMERAERHFRDAVRTNPKHLEANQELRLIEMRKKNPPTKKGGGFFS